MDSLLPLIQLGAYLTMGLTLVAALGIVTLRNLFHSALCLALVLIGTAGLYIVLHAPFLAVVQILLYVGAVMTLVIFAVMLTERIGESSIRQNNNQSLPAALGVLAFISSVSIFIVKTPWPISSFSTQHTVSVTRLGESLMGRFVFPFEVVSVILIAALIGAIVIAKKDQSS